MEQRRRSKLEYAVRKLYRILANRCRGTTVIFGCNGSHLAQEIRKRGLDVVEVDVHASKSSHPELSRDDEKVGTVIVTEIPETTTKDEARQLLAKAWRPLEPGGRIIVTVPNKECTTHPSAIRRFSQRNLTHLLKPLGTPRLNKEQPYQWLSMYVDKPRGDRPQPGRSLKSRYRVTARLCKGKVLELGCGEGHLAKMIADRKLDVTGVDIDGNKIRRARKDYSEIEFIQSDIRDLKLKKKFDTVVIAEVLEHLPEATGSEVLAKASELTKKGGRLVVSVPNEDCIPHPNHIRQFGRRSLKRLLKPLGKPQLVADQPFKWLMMYVDKKKNVQHSAISFGKEKKESSELTADSFSPRPEGLRSR